MKNSGDQHGLEEVRIEASKWWNSIQPREEYVAQLRTQRWQANTVSRWSRLAFPRGWAAVAIACVLVLIAPLGVPSVRAIIAPPYLPEVERQELLGDAGVREYMSVVLTPGPKVFEVTFRSDVASQSRAEAAIREKCPDCNFRFDWASSKELVVYLPRDPATKNPYTVGLIDIALPGSLRRLYSVAPGDQDLQLIDDITGLTPRSVSPDGRYVLLSRTSNSGDHPPATYILDLDSSARTQGTFVLPGSWTPSGVPLLQSSDGAVLDLRGEIVVNPTGNFAEAGPNMAVASWRRRGGAWDLIIKRKGLSDVEFSLPDTNDPSPTLGGSRVGYPLWQLRWSPDGQRLLAVYATLDQSGVVLLVDPVHNSVSHLDVGSFDQTVLWLPDGEHIAVVQQDATKVFNLDGTLVQTLPGRAKSWSPDGRYILFHDRLADQEGATQWVFPQGLTPVGWRSDGVLVVSVDEGL